MALLPRLEARLDCALRTAPRAGGATDTDPPRTSPLIKSLILLRRRVALAAECAGWATVGSCGKW